MEPTLNFEQQEPGLFTALSKLNPDLEYQISVNPEGLFRIDAVRPSVKAFKFVGRCATFHDARIIAGDDDRRTYDAPRDSRKFNNEPGTLHYPAGSVVFDQAGNPVGILPQPVELLTKAEASGQGKPPELPRPGRFAYCGAKFVGMFDASGNVFAGVDPVYGPMIFDAENFAPTLTAEPIPAGEEVDASFTVTPEAPTAGPQPAPPPLRDFSIFFKSGKRRVRVMARSWRFTGDTVEITGTQEDPSAVVAVFIRSDFAGLTATRVLDVDD